MLSRRSAQSPSAVQDPSMTKHPLTSPPCVWLVRFSALALLALLAGCGEAEKAEENAQTAEKELPWKGVNVRLVVAGDSRLAQTIGRLKAEWRATTGAEL